MHWNKHSCSLDLAGDRRAAFSIVPVGNQIADSARLISMQLADVGTLR
jgi:hypothetical protein